MSEREETGRADAAETDADEAPRADGAETDADETPQSQVRLAHTHDGNDTGGTSPVGTGRRRFLTWFSIGGGGLIGAMLGIPIVGFLLGPLLKKSPQQWREIGAVGDFTVGETKVITFENTAALPWSGQTANTAAYLRRQSDDSFVALAIYCTHLGCPVNWQPDAGIFLCPCHGGVYYADGSVAAGPPPHDLYHYETRVVSGKVQLLTGPLPTA